MKAILEFKDEQKDSTFYRYNIDGTLVWFDQHADSGHIFTVSVKPGDKLANRFNFYVKDGSRSRYYYPICVEIITNSEGLTIDLVDGYVSCIVYAKMVAEAIMEIFESGEHIELYKLHHKEM